MGYDEKYKSSESYFGVEPDPVLRDFHHLLTKPGPVLDIGAGQGRNAVFLARGGFVVYAFDPSGAAVKTTAEMASKEKLPICAFHCGYETFSPPEGRRYFGILLFGIISEQPWKSIPLLIEKVRAWSAEGGYIFATAFTIRDPGYLNFSRDWPRIGERSFIADDGEIKTYLEPGEILDLFPGFTVVHHQEEMGPKHRHIDGPLEQHARAAAVFQLQKR